MDARLNYYGNPVGEKFQKYLNSAGRSITSTLPAETADLCKIRASQINGCSVCTDMHTKDAAHAGETSGRLNLAAAWGGGAGFTGAGPARSVRATRTTTISTPARWFRCSPSSTPTPGSTSSPVSPPGTTSRASGAEHGRS